jgi:hypothetical protein
VIGKVIVGGGGRRVEVYDPNANSFVMSGGSVEDEWFYATATMLPDGKVFIAGGYNDSLHPTNQTWIYQPPDVARTISQQGTNQFYNALAIRPRRFLRAGSL